MALLNYFPLYPPTKKNKTKPKNKQYESTIVLKYKYYYYFDQQSILIKVKYTILKKQISVYKLKLVCYYNQMILTVHNIVNRTNL